MEYYGLILNRSFLIFIRPEGLYGWKFYGLVSAHTPRYFEGVEAFLDQPEMTPGSVQFDELMKKSGSFFIPKSEIQSVFFINKPKWGMGPVPHSGKLYVTLSGSRKREFILLGSVDGESIRNQVCSALGCD
jgi:hypothetical protein